MQTLHLTLAARVMKMSAGELEEERRRLLVELMLRKPDSVSMLAKSMRKNAVLPADMEDVLREYAALERKREGARKTLRRLSRGSRRSMSER